MENSQVIIAVLIVIGLTIGILAAFGVFNPKSNNNHHDPSDENDYSVPYIDPQPFKTGYLTDPPQKLANLCSDVMYPVNPPYVQYGQWNGGDCCSGKCDVDEFNSAP